MKYFLFILFQIFLSAGIAKAGVSDLEFSPYLGYEIGSIKQSNIKRASTYGPNFGIKITNPSKSLGPIDIKPGIDVMYGSEKGSQNEYVDSYNPLDIGPHLGIGLAPLGEIYFSYFIFSRAKLQPDQNTHSFAGSGFKLGAGISNFSFLKLSFEYIRRNYNSYNKRDLSNRLEANSYGLSVSVPFGGSGAPSSTSSFGGR